MSCRQKYSLPVFTGIPEEWQRRAKKKMAVNHSEAVTAESDQSGLFPVRSQIELSELFPGN